MRTTPYQFAFHDRVKDTPPTDGSVVNLFNRLKNSEQLDRATKDSLFHSLQGTNAPNYKIAGWVFPFAQFMKCYLVKRSYNSHWDEILAFDKTCIRKSFYTNECIVEIIEIPKK